MPPPSKKLRLEVARTNDVEDSFYESFLGGGSSSYVHQMNVRRRFSNQDFYNPSYDKQLSRFEKDCHQNRKNAFESIFAKYSTCQESGEVINLEDMTISSDQGFFRSLPQIEFGDLTNYKMTDYGLNLLNDLYNEVKPLQDSHSRSDNNAIIDASTMFKEKKKNRLELNFIVPCIMRNRFETRNQFCIFKDATQILKKLETNPVPKYFTVYYEKNEFQISVMQRDKKSTSLEKFRKIEASPSFMKEVKQSGLGVQITEVFD